MVLCRMLQTPPIPLVMIEALLAASTRNLEETTGAKPLSQNAQANFHSVMPSAFFFPSCLRALMSSMWSTLIAWGGVGLGCKSDG